ncbi:MAG: hypothetical protein ABL986_14295 [Vicinamibacterales bacterium]
MHSLPNRPSREIFLLLLLVGLTVVLGCRQPDGLIPTLDEENANRIEDLANDLRATARGEADAGREFVKDYAIFVDPEDTAAVEALGKLGTRLAEAVKMMPLTEKVAHAIARIAWTVVGATELSDRQVQALQQELLAQLDELGVDSFRAKSIADEIPRLQAVVTSRPRRFYEWR